MVKKIFIEKLSKNFYMDYDTKRLYSDEGMTKEICPRLGGRGYSDNTDLFIINIDNKTFVKSRNILFYETFKEDILKNGIEGKFGKLQNIL